MAASEEGRRLTESHRQAQVRLQAETFLRLQRVWPALDAGDLARTWPAVEEAAAALVTSYRPRSARLSAAYLEMFMQREAFEQLSNDPILMERIDPEKLRTSLRVTGPVAIKSATARGVPLETATRNALVTVAGAVRRHVGDGGRETLLATALNEGFNRYTRVSDGNPCAFCAMLVSRGPVYLSAESGGFQSHDHCGCTAEIVVAGDGWTPEARRLHDFWNDATRGETDQLTAFRNAYQEARSGSAS